MFGIVFQNLTASKGCQNFIQTDLHFNHLAVGMLCDPESPGHRPGFDASQGALEFGYLTLFHASASVPHPLP